VVASVLGHAGLLAVSDAVALAANLQLRHVVAPLALPNLDFVLFYVFKNEVVFVRDLAKDGLVDELLFLKGQRGANELFQGLVLSALDTCVLLDFTLLPRHRLTRLQHFLGLGQ
jgi:hypothetical protein